MTTRHPRVNEESERLTLADWLAFESADDCVTPCPACGFVACADTYNFCPGCGGSL